MKHPQGFTLLSSQSPREIGLVKNSGFKVLKILMVLKQFRMETLSHHRSASTTRFHGFHRHHYNASPQSHSSTSPQVLRFAYNKKFCPFKVLRFGQVPVPGVLSKMMVTLVTLLCHQGIQVHLLLDDLLIRSPSLMQAQAFCLSLSA